MKFNILIDKLMSYLKLVGAEIILDRRSVAAVRDRLDSRSENLLLGIERSTPSVSRISPNERKKNNLIFIRFSEKALRNVLLTRCHVC